MYDQFEESGISKQEWQEMIGNAVEKSFRELLIETGFLPNSENVKAEPRWVSLTEFCLELQISKQTIYNWRKNPTLATLIENFIVKVGPRKIIVEIEGFKNCLRQYKGFFGGGKDYRFTDQLKSDEYKKSKKLASIRSKTGMFKEPLTPEEQEFLDANDDDILDNF